jgi:AcrR family transcriptional regulator
MLDAAERVIAEGGVASLTVSEVVRRAGSSVGAFYARFPDKDALLSTLHERSCSEALATAELALDPARWESADLATALYELVRFTAAMSRERRGLLLAFVASAATDVTYAERRARLDAGLANLLLTFLKARAGEVEHPNLRTAADVSIHIIMGSLEYEATLHGSVASMDASADRLASELARAVLAYIGAKPQDRRTARSVSS